jgi:hypothetical protein
MADYRTTLQRLIEAEKSLTPERAAQLSELARTIADAKLDLTPVAKQKPAAVISPRQQAREAYAALAPLPAGATGAQKLARAREQARLLTISTGMRGDSVNGTTYYVDEDGPEAA